MSVTLLLLGFAAVSGAIGIGKSFKAGTDQYKAGKLNRNTKERLDYDVVVLNKLRAQCDDALTALGEEKLFVLNGSVRAFLEQFTKIKNVDFSEASGFNEVYDIHIDKNDFDELGVMKNIAIGFAGGAVAGAAGGALAAFGAYGLAMTFASASTGTAIATLSGAAATNATLAFFGGGSLAAGGLGMAGGTAVLGGVVAGPALLVMGFIAGAQAGINLDKAKENAAVADETCEQLELGAEKCIAIRRMTYMFYSLLARLDTYFLPLIYEMENIIKTEGTDYRDYSLNSRKTIASAAALAVTIKTVLDTPILSVSGEITDNAAATIEELSEKSDMLTEE